MAIGIARNTHLSVSAISELTGYDRKTVRKYLLEPEGVPSYGARAPAPSDLLPIISSSHNLESSLENSRRSFRMKKTKFSEEQMIGAVKQLEAGRSARDLARELGISDQTLYNWRAKYSGLDAESGACE